MIPSSESKTESWAYNPENGQIDRPAVLRVASSLFSYSSRNEPNKQKPIDASRRVKPLMSHLSNPAMTLMNAPREIPLVLQSAKGGQNGSWEMKTIAKTTGKTDCGI
jgi:hypothetical protein